MYVCTYSHTMQKSYRRFMNTRLQRHQLNFNVVRKQSNNGNADMYVFSLVQREMGTDMIGLAKVDLCFNAV